MKFSDLKFTANTEGSLRRLCHSIYNEVERLYPFATVKVDTADNVAELTKEVIIRIQVPYNALESKSEAVTKVQEKSLENLVEVSQDRITFK